MCFFLTEACELHIMAKTRPRQKLLPMAEDNQAASVDQEETAENAQSEQVIPAVTSHSMIIECRKEGGSSGFSDTITVFESESELGRLAAENKN